MMRGTASRLRRWVDAHLVGIGIAMLVLSIALTSLLAIYQEVSVITSAPSNLVVIGLVLAAQLARIFFYLSGFLLGVGVLLRNWQVVLVGFEGTNLNELMVDGPDGNNIVWLGKRYANAFEAEAAFGALERRAAAERED